MIYATVVLETEIEKLCSLYCEEENVSLTNEYIEKSKETYRTLTAKGDAILGIFEKNEDVENVNLIGCVSIHYLDDLYPGYENAPYVHLETIIVKKNYRGKGFGTLLLKEALKLCKDKGITYIIAQTGADNVAMRRVYEKVGLVNDYVNYYKKLI
ncbi:GNAT family N-acetyltransferase [Desulfitobacterium sp. AusDCA]|uniref:GNAT family N-acetyltransferase n=1 Tax=Desulfitobacterium sp. AusDCA TaxID=3240383 RepID=UPI003DA6E36F